jgi:tRNA modification GTPase
VSPIAGTTRDYLTRPIDLGGTTAELIDTAGWQAGEDTIAEQAQRLGREQATHADVIMWCVEAGGDFLESDAELLRTSPARVIRVRTKWDLLAPRSKEGPAVPVSVVSQYGLDRLRERLKETVVSLTRSPLAPSQSRCRHHVAASIEELRRARSQVEAGEPPELTAASLRFVIDQLGEVTGAVYTNDLLDRIFSRFCIGK